MSNCTGKMAVSYIRLITAATTTPPDVVSTKMIASIWTLYNKGPPLSDRTVVGSTPGDVGGFSLDDRKY